MNDTARVLIYGAAFFLLIMFAGLMFSASVALEAPASINVNSTAGTVTLWAYNNSYSFAWAEFTGTWGFDVPYEVTASDCVEANVCNVSVNVACVNQTNVTCGNCITYEEMQGRMENLSAVFNETMNTSIGSMVDWYNSDYENRSLYLESWEVNLTKTKSKYTECQNDLVQKRVEVTACESRVEDLEKKNTFNQYMILLCVGFTLLIGFKFMGGFDRIGRKGFSTGY